MNSLITDVPETQEPHSLENPIHHKVVKEIAPSASLPKRFFHGPRRQRHSFVWNDNDAWSWRVEAAIR